MREYEPDHIGLVLAIENGEFDKASEILTSDRKNRYVHPVGALQVTALQMAAWQGNINLLNRLYEKGADVNSMDKIGRCALYYAAHNGNTDVTKWLLRHAGHIDVKVGIYSCSKEPYSSLTKSYLVGKNLPLPVCWGRTPLHQAVKNNHADVVRILVEGGADVNVKDERLISPLLLAGSAVERDDLNEMTKFVEIVRLLVAAKVSVDVIHPDTGTTALHHAAMLGSADATKILLSNGAKPTYKCKSSGSTPLHVVASTGSIETLMVLLEAMQCHNIDIDTRDEINRTALHRAAYKGHRECVRALINHGANLAAVTKTGVTVVDAIFAHISRPLTFLTDVLDSCVQTTSNSSLEKYENVTVDFGILAPKHQQMAVVTAIIAAASGIRQLAILQHPLVETFLRLKWARLRILFFLLILVHLLFVISLSVYAIMFTYNNADHVVTRRILAICSCILLFHNTIQVILEPKHYLRQLETWLSLVCAMLALMTSIAGEFAKCSKEEIKSRHCVHWVLHSISIAILLSWMQMMLLIGRVPMLGYYALMFSTVLKNILKVLLAFCYLIIGFALSFAVLFHGNNQFQDFGKAIVKTMVMMTGEYEYNDLFESNYLPVTSRIVFVSFIMLVGIVLINLMIGLAVNDIQGLEKEGHIRRLLKQAEFVAHLERVTSHRIFRSNWLHPRLRKLLHSRRDIPTKITLVSRENYFHHMSHFTESPPKIPADLIEALFLLASKTPCRSNNLADKNVEIDDTKLISILSNLEEQIRELKTYRNLSNRRSSKRRKFERKAVRI